MQDPDTRLNAVPMGGMPMNHRRATNPMDMVVDMEWLGPPIKLVETHDSLGGNKGAFCYVYV
jgi:tyrosinase